MQPIVSVYRIENGFLVELCPTHDNQGEMKSVSYAKDATGIAELIVAAAAREVLGVRTQQEMFTAAQMGTTLAKTKGHPIT